MKILQVNKAFYPHIGGVETVVKDIASQTIDSAIKIDVLTCNTPSGPTVEKLIDGILVMRQKTFFTVKSNPISISFLIRFFQLTRDYSVFHLHEPFPLGSLISWMLPTRVKLVVTWHSDIVRQKFLKLLVLPFQALTLYRANVIIATSEVMKSQSFIRFFKKKVIVIPLSIPDEYLDYSEEDNRFFLFVGRLVYYKGIMTLLEAQRISGLPLKIIGDGPLLAKINEYIKKNNMTNVELIKGPISDSKLSDYFRACTALVFPSNEVSEAFGIVQLQAMAKGKPVINTRINSGVPEVSVNEVSGITIKPNSPLELSSAMVRIFGNNKDRVKFSKKAYERVRSKFLHSKTLKQILDLYKRLG
jgi:glycosyltransferase involved in cell wall biosynthesis